MKKTRTMNMRSAYLVFVFSFLLTAGFVSAQGHEERLREIDVQHYDLNIAINDSTDNIQGDASVTVKFLKEVDTLRLDLTAVEEGKGMRVMKVTSNKKELKFSHVNHDLNIAVGDIPKEGEERVYTISYHGIPADGLIISQSKFDKRTFFGDNWPNRAHNYFPCVDHPSDKATVDFTIVHPNHYQVVSNGRLLEEIDITPELRKTHWSSTTILPTKVMVFGAAQFAVQHSGSVGNTDVSAWVFPENKDEGFHDYELAVSVLDYYTKLIAPYPYQKLANVQSKTRYGGMENAGCIFYSESSITGDRKSEGLIAHEIVHQWYGNSASEANWHHVWLSEGFATYLTHMYFEDVYGKKKFQDGLKIDRQRVTKFKLAFSMPIVDPSIKNLNALLNVNTYQKASWVLHMLRNKIGDEKFKTGIRNYYAQYEFGNAMTDDFVKVMEEASGQDLKPFFKQWIYGAGHPVIEYTWNYNAKKKILQIELEQKQEGEIYEFPIEFGALMKGDEEAKEVFSFNVDEKKAEFEVELDYSPDFIIMDPNVKLLHAVHED